MEFPQGSLVPKNEMPIADNAKAVEERIKEVDWGYLMKAYAVAWSILLVSVFTMIVIIRLALNIF